MTISRKAEICGWSGLTPSGRHDTFTAHDEQIRHFRRNHGGTAGIEVAVMMRLPLYVMMPVRDYGGSTGFISVKDLPGLMVMKRLPLRILPGY